MPLCFFYVRGSRNTSLNLLVGLIEESFENPINDGTIGVGVVNNNFLQFYISAECVVRLQRMELFLNISSNHWNTAEYETS